MNKVQEVMILIYRIAGKVGGSYIWRIRYFCCLAEFNLAVAQSENPPN